MATRQPATRTRGMVSLAEAAELAGLSIRTLRRRIAEGELPAYRTGPRLIRVHPDDLVTLVVPMNTAAAERLEVDSAPDRPSSSSRAPQRTGQRFSSVRR